MNVYPDIYKRNICIVEQADFMLLRASAAASNGLRRRAPQQLPTSYTLIAKEIHPRCRRSSSAAAQ